MPTQSEEVLDLINGTFSEEDAKEILRNLFEYKINYHKIRDFNSQIRFGLQEEHSLQRAEELKVALARMISYFGKEQAAAYRITSKVVIEPIEE
jgi:bisphosphoglycerate-dependent phosphoglycerate mutase